MLVLLAEDSDTLREALAKQIKSMGHQVHAVRNGWHAVLSSHAYKYDLVLMDMHMPVMDGWDATQLIRNHEQVHGSNNVPIIAVTSIFDRQACLAAGLTDHVRKPTTYMQLCALLRHWELKLAAQQLGQPADHDAMLTGESAEAETAPLKEQNDESDDYTVSL